MIKFYIKDKRQPLGIEALSDLENLKDVYWIDMVSPALDVLKLVENNFDIKFPTKQESQEIEISSRYWEENESIEINSFFLLFKEDYAKNETVSFILKNELLISIRYTQLKTFDDISRKIASSGFRIFKSGDDILNAILDVRIDSVADIVEDLSKEITKLRRLVLTDYKNKDEDILGKISKLEELNMLIIENLKDKQRILASLLKSHLCKQDIKEDISIMLKDIRSLVDYTQFNFERLEYLQNVFVGVLSIEQTKVVKIFTIVNVVFLPPTLIASIYGMNFALMPELKWEYGYLFSLGLMALSVITPLYIFKKKGWM